MLIISDFPPSPPNSAAPSQLRLQLLPHIHVHKSLEICRYTKHPLNFALLICSFGFTQTRTFAKCLTAGLQEIPGTWFMFNQLNSTQVRSNQDGGTAPAQHAQHLRSIWRVKAVYMLHVWSYNPSINFQYCSSCTHGCGVYDTIGKEKIKKIYFLT